jgi:hypothetical protein
LLVEATRASQPGLAEDALAVAAEQGRLYLTDPDHAEGAGQLLFSDPNLNRPPNEDNRFELADYATLATGRLARIVNLGPQQGAWISYSMLVRLTLDARPLGPPVRLGAPELGPDAHQSFLLGCTTTRCLAGVVTRDEPPLQGYIVELPEPIYQDHPQPLAKWQKCGEIPRVRWPWQGSIARTAFAEGVVTSAGQTPPWSIQSACPARRSSQQHALGRWPSFRTLPMLAWDWTNPLRLHARPLW